MDPYKNGPSALDKAAELFFFTEILRGTLYSRIVFVSAKSLTVKGLLRHVGCGRANLPAAIHDHVCEHSIELIRQCVWPYVHAYIGTPSRKVH